MKTRFVNRAVFEAAAEIVSPGTAVSIRDDYRSSRGQWCIGVSGPPAAVLTFVFGLGRLDDPGQRAIADDLISDIAYRVDGIEILAAFPSWQFEPEGEQ